MKRTNQIFSFPMDTLIDTVQQVQCAGSQPITARPVTSNSPNSRQRGPFRYCNNNYCHWVILNVESDIVYLYCSLLIVRLFLRHS